MTFNNWDEAVKAMATEDRDSYRRGSIARFLMDYLEYPDDKQIATSVYDWLIEGDWAGNETIVQIQTELNDTFVD